MIRCVWLNYHCSLKSVWKNIWVWRMKQLSSQKGFPLTLFRWLFLLRYMKRKKVNGPAVTWQLWCCSGCKKNICSFMMTSSNGNIFRVTGPLCGESTFDRWFPHTKRPVTCSFDAFFDVRLNKRLSKQSRCWCLKMPLGSLWHHCNVFCSADGQYTMTEETKARLQWNGVITWKPPARLSCSCTMEVRYFPFDNQICELEFGSWTYNQDEVGRADSRFAPSQWETVLLCNDVSHWLGASLESALGMMRRGHG